MGILVGGACSVTETFLGKCWENEACSSCGSQVTGTAHQMNVGALVCKCPMVHGTTHLVSMGIGSPSGNWYLVAGTTKGLYKGDGALFGSWYHLVAVIPGKHLEAVAVS